MSRFAKPALMSYSRDVMHVGGLGAGQLAKACNNLLHWIHSVGNYEALLLAKRYGVDAQRMREVLLLSPGTNGTLERWDETRFTWHEKDMDVVHGPGPSRRAHPAADRSGRPADQTVLGRRRARPAAWRPNAQYLGQRFTALWPLPMVASNR